MLCPVCRRWVARTAGWCRNCGAVFGETAPGLGFVLPDGGRAPVTPGSTIGRGAWNDVRLTDPSVSRAHARVAGTAAAPSLVDTGSAAGTWLDGRTVGDRPVELHDGSTLRLGDAELTVERRRDPGDSGRTTMVPARAPELTGAIDAGDALALRPGQVLKRLAAAEGPRRWVLQDPGSGAALRFGDEDAAVLRLLDGERPVSDVLLAAEKRLGPEGPARVAALLAELADRGLLDGAAAAAPARRTGWRSLFTPHDFAWAGAGDAIDALYARGGWRLVTETGIVSLGAVALAGVIAFIVLLTSGHSQPFVVANRVGLGGAVFLVGRFLVAAVHETAHGLVLAACGRRVREAGLKLVLIFPYVYVDTSEAWLEPARRRVAVTAAGPASDLVLGGTFAVMALAAAPGAFHDVLFQLALGAYLGAVFNLNPMVERDGYQLLADLLREPGLRARGREALARRLHGDRDVPAVLWRYGALGLLWSVVAAGLVIAVSLRTAQGLQASLPTPAISAGLGLTWMVLLAPPVLLVGRLLRRPGRT
jgi:FHA domain